MNDLIDAVNSDAHQSSDAAASDAQQQQSDAQQSDASWSYAEGIPGQGEPPDFFKADKYANITEQAKAYRELEKKFGNFTGAPDKYEVQLSEALSEKGISISEDDPLYTDAIEFAKNSNMSQEGFNQLMDLYATSKLAESEAIKMQVEQETKALGPRAQERINNLINWGKANLPEDMYDGFEAMPTSANAVKALEHIISLTRSAPITSNNSNATSGAISEEEVRKMQFEKDEFGNRRIQTDPEFRARFKKLSSQVWGDHDHNIVIGGK